MAELFLVRHAQASFHGADYDRLSELGQQQSQWLGEYFSERGLVFDAYVSGTLRRHRQTLEGIRQLLPQNDTARVETVAGLDEYDFRALVQAFVAANPAHPLVAAWEMSRADKAAFYRLLKLAMSEWAAATLPGSLPESWVEFRERIECAARALQSLAAGHRRILAISSGGAMAALLGGRLDLRVGHIVDLNMQIRNTAVCHFFVNPQRFLLSSWNAVPHLEGGGRDNTITYG